jgi:hypothetical protein
MAVLAMALLATALLGAALPAVLLATPTLVGALTLTPCCLAFASELAAWLVEESWLSH